MKSSSIVKLMRYWELLGRWNDGNERWREKKKLNYSKDKQVEEKDYISKAEG